MEEDNEDLGAWKVGVVMKLYRPLCVNAPATSYAPTFNEEGFGSAWDSPFPPSIGFGTESG